MARTQTEARHREAAGLDAQPPRRALEIMAAAQTEAARAVAEALDGIAGAAEIAAATLRGGGRLVYAGAGSSGLMALADALELPGTFGIPRAQVTILFAGGSAALHDMRGGAEDDEAQGAADVAAAAVGASDCALGVSASGSTPYTLGALREAKRRGARTVAVANNAGAPLFAGADAAIHLPTPPEVLAGSTRMGAGTAQKIALNLFSTLTAMRLGHVYDGMMVDVVADNAKLRGRAARMVEAIASVDAATAENLLEKGDGSVKTAVLLAAGAPDRAAAQELLDRAGHDLRRALSTIKGSSRSEQPSAQAQTGSSP